MAGDLAVSGRGVANLQPDEAEIHATVRASRPSATLARSAVASVSGAVSSGLGEIENVVIETQGYTVEPEETYDDVLKATKITGYRASQAVVIRMRNFTNEGLAAVIDRTVDVGDDLVQISNVRAVASSTLRSSAEREALELAVANATSRASILAQAAGVTLGKIVHLEGNVLGGGMQPAFLMVRGGTGSAPPTSMNMGAVRVEASASVKYELQ